MDLDIKKLRTDRGLSQQALSEKTGIPAGRINNWEQGKGKPKFDDKQKLLEFFELSDKSISGENPTSVRKGDKNENYVKIPSGKYGSDKNQAERIKTQTMFVPLVNQYAYAGYMAGFSDPEYMEELPMVAFHVDHDGKGNYVCFEMRGESMFDGSYQSLLAGDQLLSREIQRQHWQNKLHIKKYRFVIAHKEQGVIVKYITNHDVLNNKITVHSLNPEFEDQVLDLNEVAQIFNVVKVQRS